jgi:hypothetical protein
VVKFCEKCGTILSDTREGVKLTPIKARLYDLIKIHPGVTRAELADFIYPKVTPASTASIGSHVKQLRDLFKDHPKITVLGMSGHGYRVVK